MEVSTDERWHLASGGKHLHSAIAEKGGEGELLPGVCVFVCFSFSWGLASSVLLGLLAVSTHQVNYNIITRCL